MKKLIVDCATGEETYVDLTPEEIAEFEENKAKALAEIQAKEQAELERQKAKDSAQAKLASLGLSGPEIEALLGV